jgi:hypothetical protein
MVLAAKTRDRRSENAATPATAAPVSRNVRRLEPENIDIARISRNPAASPLITGIRKIYGVGFTHARQLKLRGV